MISIGTDTTEKAVSGEQIPFDPRVIARMAMNLRNRRNALMDPRIFSNPAWDAMLLLYLESDDGRPLDFAYICDKVGCASSVMIRWLNVLAKEGSIAAASNGELRFWIAPKGKQDLEAIFGSLPL